MNRAAVNPGVLVAVLAFVGAGGLLIADAAFDVVLTLEWEDEAGASRTLLIAVDGRERYWDQEMDNAVQPHANGSLPFRLTVTNDRPLPLERDLRVMFGTHDGRSGTREALVEETLRVAAHEARVVPFTVNASEATRPPENEGGLERPDPFISLTIRFGRDTHFQHVRFTDASGDRP